MDLSQGLLSCIPILVLIICVMITHRMTESMALASLLAAVLAYGSHFVTGYVSMLYAALSDPAYQLLLLVAGAFGGIIALLEKSGALYGFRDVLLRWCKGPKRTMVLTWVLGGIVFIDDYLNALTVSVTMKGICDHYRIPREHLAYTINCMGACVCVLIPISSWSAFAIGSLADYGLTAVDYYRAIPYMLYPLLCLTISLLLACRRFPLLGGMKQAYARVAQGGPTLDTEDAAVSETEAPVKNGKVRNFLIPMACLFVGMLASGNDILVGILLALAALLVLLCGVDKMKLRDFTDSYLKGIADMVPLLTTILMGFAMLNAVESMGFNDFLVSACSEFVAPQFLPMAAFLLVACAAFLAASFWMLIVITFPIFIPLAQTLGINPSIIIAAVMSGVALGSQACIFSDAVFMVASGTGVSNDRQFRAILPYVAIGAGLAAIGYLILGFL